MGRFFVDTGDGIEFKKTEAEAKALAAESLEFWRNRARQNGEWDDEAGHICWGPVREQSKEQSDGEVCDYVLKAV